MAMARLIEMSVQTFYRVREVGHSFSMAKLIEMPVRTFYLERKVGHS